MRSADEALEYLAETDAETAAAKADMENAENQKKATLAIIMASLTGSIAQRKMEAEADPRYDEKCLKHTSCIYEYELLKNKRKTAELEFEYWRTVSANQRAGQVV